MLRTITVVCLLSLPLLFTLSIGNSETKNFEMSISSINLEKLPLVELSVKAVDVSNRFIKDIGREQVKIYVDQVVIPDFSLHLVGPEENLSVILAIDVSGSMKGKPMEDAITAASLFVEGLDEKDHVALCAFSDEVRFYHDFINQPDVIKRDLAGLSPSGNTVLYDAIYRCIEFSNIVRSDKKAVIVLSDGKDTDSELELVDCIAFAQNSATPIYSIGLGSESERGKIKKVLGRLSRLSGGVYFYTPSSGELSELYNIIREQLKNDYKIVFQLPEQFFDQGKHNILIEIDYHGVLSKASIDANFVKRTVASRSTLFLFVGVVGVMLLFGAGFVILAYLFLKRARV
jgi:VWFA-related protein